MRRRGSAGFTLVEMTVALAILSVMSTLAVVSFSSYLWAARLDGGVATFSGAIREAQIRAVREGRPWRVSVTVDSFRLQSAPSSQTDLSCNSAGWSDWRKPEPLPAGVIVQNSSLPCITFSASGRAGWPSVRADPSSSNPYTGDAAFVYLFDGMEAEDPLYTGGVFWESANYNPVEITLDLRETRALETFCIGMWSDMDVNLYGYPSSVEVEGSTDGGSWNPIASQAGPGDPTDGGLERTCLSIAVNGSYRYLRMVFGPNGSLVVLDEIEVGNLFVTVATVKGSRRILANPVTGRVSVVR